MTKAKQWLLLSIGVTALSFFILRTVVAVQGTVLSFHGELAMALGVFFTTVIGMGLMSLAFHSNKEGYDQAVYDSTSEAEQNQADE